MSILYKALDRAAKAREALVSGAVPMGQPLPLARGGKRKPQRLVIFGVAFGGTAVVLIATMFLFSGPSTERKPSGPRPTPQIHVAGVRPQAGAVTPTQNPVAAAPAPAAVPSVAPEPAAPPSTVRSEAVQNAVPPLPPAIAAPSPATASMPKPAAQVVPTVAVDEDLPAILDRIRRSKTASTVSQPVVVDRARTSYDVTNADGGNAISVAAAPLVAHEEAKSAYDLLLHGQYDEALRLYNKVLKATPENVPLLLGKAAAEQKLQRISEARDTYRHVLARDPENREALTNMTVMVAMQAPDQALAELQSLRRNNPAFSPIPAQIASLEAARGDLGAAIAAMSDALRISPDNGLYRLNLAILQDRAGLAEDAAASYQAAVDLMGSSAPAALPLDKIRERMRFLQGR